MKLGTVRMGPDNRLWKIVRDNNSEYYRKIWIHATKYDIKCYKELKLAISKNIKRFKNKELKSKKQAIAISYAFIKKVS